MTDQARPRSNPLPVADKDDATAAEQAAATHLAETLDRVERGAFDELPNLRGDEPWLTVLPLTHALRGLGPTGEFAPAQQEALWQRIAPRLHRQVRLQRRRDWLWRFVGAGFASAAAAAALLLVFSPLSPSNSVAPSTSPAVAALERELPSYASRLLTEPAAPQGDTPLRELREARSRAWQQDAATALYAGARGREP